MNYLAVKAQHEAEERHLERKGWSIHRNIDQKQSAAIPANRGKWPVGSKYHWDSETMLVPPSRD